MIGIDEVGRGSWAGPLVVCAARLNKPINGLKDSKLFSKKRREELFVHIEKNCDIGVGWVSADEIDDIGLSAALYYAAGCALAELSPTSEEVVIDGSIQLLPAYEASTVRIKADNTVPAVSAASIYAKVIRDNWMCSQDSVYAAYDFWHNVGYGTLRHRKAIEQYGITPLHRTSFSLPSRIV